MFQAQNTSSEPPLIPSKSADSFAKPVLNGISSEFLSLTFKIKRQEAPHDGSRPPGSDGAILSEKAPIKQQGFTVNLEQIPTYLAKDMPSQR